MDGQRARAVMTDTTDVAGGDRFTDTVLRVVERDWELFGLQQPTIIDIWRENERILVVFQPLPRTQPDAVYGVDWHTQVSPTGLTDARPEEIATEVARHLILEPRGVDAPTHPEPGTIYWTTYGTDERQHPRTLGDLSSRTEHHRDSPP